MVGDEICKDLCSAARSLCSSQQSKKEATKRLRFAGPWHILCATPRLHMPASFDRIEKRILLRAPLDRVWRAFADSGEFGTWFGMRFAEPFRAGARMRGT